MQKISRQKTVEGTRIPAIIRNGNFHYINMEVYEDGMVNCWDLVDIKGLKEKLKTNWLVTQIPEGEHISIFHLGNYKVIEARWDHDNKSYFNYIKKTIKKLNPKLTNIYTVTQMEEEKLERRRIRYSPSPKEFYVKSELGYRTVGGGGFTVFLKHDSKTYLVNLVVYKDGNIVCYNAEFEIKYTIENIKEMFDEGIFFTSFNQPMPVIFSGLGELTLSNSSGGSVDIYEKYKELKDIHDKLNGSESILDRCRNAYLQYLQYPSEEARECLRTLYEQVPDHERIYLGDMDSRNTDYERILYHPQHKREV
jgi:hypothetical protein